MWVMLFCVFDWEECEVVVEVSDFGLSGFGELYVERSVCFFFSGM